MSKNVNWRSKAAKERKESVKKEKARAIEKAKEDEYWKDNDKHVNRKLERQQERERKQIEEQERKRQLKAMYETDMATTVAQSKSKSSKNSSAPIVSNLSSGARMIRPEESGNKMTRFEIEKKLEEERIALEKRNIGGNKKVVAIHEQPLEPNTNRLEDELKTIDEVLSTLSTKDKTTPNARISRHETRSGV